MSGWLAKLEGYVARRLPGAKDVSLRPAGSMPAGASNATIALDLSLTCDGRPFEVPLVLRPERQGGLLAPYDVARQFRIMRALSNTAVPVPAVAWHEPDAEVIGAPFFFMSRLVGVRTPPLFWYQPGPMVDAAARALAAVHAVPWQEGALGALAPADAASPLAAEMHAWAARAAGNGADQEPVLQRLAAQLAAHEPDDAVFALVHGDTNAGNYLFRGESVAAVVDWELAAIGDPRSDLGFYAALEWMFGGGYGGDGETVLSEAYARVTGRPLPHLAFYEAWGLYRMLVIFGGRGMWNPYGFGAAIERLDAILGPAWRH